MSTGVTLIATLTGPPRAEELTELSGLAGILEVRADLFPEMDVAWLRSHFAGEILFTLRSRAEGGGSEASLKGRQRRLAAASEDYDLIDLEGERDLVPELLDRIPAGRRLISWHGSEGSLPRLQDLFTSFERHQARLYKLVIEARQAGEELAPLELLRSLRRQDVIAFASGEGAAWTRLVAPWLGAPLVFGSAGEEPAAPGQLSVRRLVEDFGLPGLPPPRALFGIVGRPIAHSLSPRLHNAVYRSIGLSALYLPFEVEAFGEFWLEVVESGSLEELGFTLDGLSVTAPHKAIALAVAGATSPLAEWVGAANTLIRRDEVWEAETTDPQGILGPLARRGYAVEGRSAAVVGAGGGGRAAAVALAQEGARVTLVNRARVRGERAAADLRVPFVPLDLFDPGEAELVVHATPLGRHPKDDLPFDVRRLRPDAVVVDLVYLEDQPTDLVREARRLGRQGIDGREVLLDQAIPQFRLMTGCDLPRKRGLAVLGLEDEA